MLLGYVKVNKCPNCDNLIAEGTYHNFNHSRSKEYSDGNNTRYSYSGSMCVSKCLKCDVIYMNDDEEFVGSYGSDAIITDKEREEYMKDIPESWSNAKTRKSLTHYEYFIALENKIVKNIVDEYLVRRGILWLFNDRVRDGKNYNETTLLINKNDKALWTKNNLRLIEIIDDDNFGENNKQIGLFNNAHILLKAELYRNLSEFEKCKEIISDKSSLGLGWPLMQLRLECKVKNTLVFEIDNSY